ncbi:MAG TPA: phosphonate ABC transporter, permease protein PhnE, partial [Clostridia bacterium]|nr:phosphonate ABC transporter, permease protein PhnE [Clostridia bacterium]
MEKITVPKPRRLRRNLTILTVTLLIVGSAWFAGFNLFEVIGNLYKGSRLLGRMFFPPDISYVPRIISPMLETIQMALVGTFIGALVALPTAVLA